MNNLSGSLSFHGDVSGQMGANLILRVEANPSGTATEILTSIRVGDIIYSIPSGGGGGGGGTDNYNDLLNKPKINNVTLSGELSLSDLGIQAKINFPNDNSKYLDGEGNFTTPPSASGVTIDTLLDESAGVTVGTTYTFLNNRKVSDYDFIELLISTNENIESDYGYDRWMMLASELSINNRINYSGYDQRWFYGEFTDTSFTQINTSGDQYPYVYKIVGVKVG